MAAPGKARPEFGARISGEEYDRRITALYRGAAPLPDAPDAERLARAELDITVDHRLGVEFPRERRESLWHAQREIERHRLRSSLRGFASAAARSVGLELGVHRAYADVLSPDELRAFLQDDE